MNARVCWFNDNLQKSITPRIFSFPGPGIDPIDFAIDHDHEQTIASTVFSSQLNQFFYRSCHIIFEIINMNQSSIIYRMILVNYQLPLILTRAKIIMPRLEKKKKKAS